MARLILQFEGLSPGSINLNLGVTRVGRAEDNDLVIRHPSVSAHHCEVELGVDFVRVRDCQSTNGTYIDNHRIQAACLEPGQALRIGDIPAIIERSLAGVSIPKIETPRPPRSLELAEGVWSCERHNGVRAEWQCSQCSGRYCGPCIHELRLERGRPHRLCPICSGHVVRIEYAGGEKKKRSVWTQVRNFLRGDG